MTAEVVNVCISTEKGVQKTPVLSAEVQVGFGIEGDAHGGDWHRQVSLLAVESADKMRELGANVGPGDFGGNIMTKGIDLPSLRIGTEWGNGEVRREATQSEKECHTKGAIFYEAGTCIMPTNGIFCRVLEGGTITPGTPIERLKDTP